MEIKTKDGKIIKFEFAHYGEQRPLNMTDGETVIAEYIKTLCPIEIVRKSDDYITAVAETETDVARFKFTDRAKWVLFPYLENNKKRRFDSLEDLNQFDDDIINSYNEAMKIY